MKGHRHGEATRKGREARENHPGLTLLSSPNSCWGSRWRNPAGQHPAGTGATRVRPYQSPSLERPGGRQGERDLRGPTDCAEV